MSPFELYDEFQLRVRSQRADVGVWIRDALPVAEGLPGQLAVLDLLKSWLDAFRPLPAVVVDEMRHYYTVSLTYNSNAIEGNTLTQNETEMVLSRGITIAGKLLVEHLEVIGHRDAMGYMEELAAQDSSLGEREIKDLHSLILRPVVQISGKQEGGVYRTVDVRAAGTGHVYPPSYQLLELMTGFANWLQSDDARRLHPVEFASEVHFRFVSIHPFLDGNGRTARLLMNLCLLRAGYPIAVITNARRAEYINALIYGQDQMKENSPWGDANRLTALVAEACEESLIDYLRMLATAGESRGAGEKFYRDVLR